MKDRDKGKSIIAFPDDFTVIDLETTGLDTSWDSIIEVSAIRYSHGKETERFSELVNSGKYTFGDRSYYVNEFITNLTGITNEMLDKARPKSEVLPEFHAFLRDDILIGHNVNFDINFIYDSVSKPFKNNYIDTLRISKKLLSDKLQRHRLSDLATYFNIDYTNAHRAAADCEITFQVFNALKSEISNSGYTFNEFIDLFKKKHIKARDVSANVDLEAIDTSTPIFSSVFVFTGTLSSMTRKEAMQCIVDRGGINGDTVTKQTNFLVLGNLDYVKSIKDGKSSKMKKAEKYKLSGQDIEIISEDVFLDMINS